VNEEQQFQKIRRNLTGILKPNKIPDVLSVEILEITLYLLPPTESIISILPRSHNAQHFPTTLRQQNRTRYTPALWNRLALIN
jgi:hypothetical protein